MNMKKFISLAEMLFQMEHETMGDSIDFHWEFNGWLDKFGESSKKFEPTLAYTKQDARELAELIKTDFQGGMWITDKHGEIYDPEMFAQYGGFITKAYERCLANFTKVGTQVEMFA